MSELAATFRQLREQAHLTQEELAERAGVSTRTVSDIERGLRRRVYADTAGRLATALGLDGAEKDHFVQVARGRESAGTAPGGSLPHPLAPILGREAEMARAAGALQPSGSGRLVTITGLGGTGKTRLAIETAHRLLPVYAGRAWFVPLDAAQTADWFRDAVAGVLGTAPAGIATVIGSRPALLVLDAFEHVLPATEALVQLLHEAPGLRALVTSRVSLGIPGEHELALGPLSPEEGERLFRDRARALLPDLPDDPAAVADICGLAGGLPLPIELAAAQVRSLPLDLLRDRLRRGLSDANRVVLDAVAWSVTSLSEPQRQVLADVAMFPAGCRLDALEAVASGLDVLAELDGLVKKNLVVLERSGGTPRWRMLDVVREVIARAQPADPERWRAFAIFYVRLLRDAGARVGHEDDWYRVLADEEPNVRVALAWADAGGDADTLLELATGMWLFWQARGGLTEGRTWLTRGLAGKPSAQLRLTALWGLAWLAYHQGDLEAATSAGEELASLAQSDGDDAARRNALTIAGMVAIARDDSATAIAQLREALDVARTLDRPWILATSLLNLALGQLAAGAPAPARTLLAEALREYEAIGDRRFQARCLGYLGLTALLDDDPTRAQALFRQALVGSHDVGEPAGIAEGLSGLAAVAAATGRPVVAATLSGAADRVRRTVSARELPLERRIAARHLDSAAQQLGTAGWDEAWSGGSELTLDEALGLALGDGPADVRSTAPTQGPHAR